MDRSTSDASAVVYVLLLVQAMAGLLAAVGELVLMTASVYAILPLVRLLALWVLAAAIVRGRRWAIPTTIVLEWLGLLGVWLGMLLGLLPGLTPSLTLTGLLTEVALPVAVIILCARLLPSPPQPPYARVWRSAGVGASGRAR